MKITIIGAAGVRTPLIVEAILKRQDKLGITELSLMDIDGERLELIGALSAPTESSLNSNVRISRTTDARQALAGADYVITTFRVGGIESRVIDERVPLNYGILGQETTGPGGFAMAIRSIPVILDFVKLMQQVCPDAWLINFANPAGMLTESVLRNTSWRRVVGICDAPASMQRVIAAILKANAEDVAIDYFGLNHLGWIKRVELDHQDYLPKLLQGVQTSGKVPGLPFDPELILSLGMIPNEYLYYYYYSHQAVNNIIEAGESRGEQITRENLNLFAVLKEKHEVNDHEGMQTAYQSYLNKRGETYMVKETGKTHDYSLLEPELLAYNADEGYAGVALNLIEALGASQPKLQILNIPNVDAITGMDPLDVVEIPALVSDDQIQPVKVGEIPAHCMGLIKQVKNYERLTIEASVEGSYPKARLALTVHPLVRDYALAGKILDGYITKHQPYFPLLK
jgi:6-phospho-beta-glucosidase